MMRRTNLGVTRPLAFILIYIFQLIGGIVFLISDRNDREIRYHARLSCYLCITEIIAVILLRMLASIPWIGWLFNIALWIVTIAYIGVMLISLARALNGTELRLPFYHNLAAKNL